MISKNDNPLSLWCSLKRENNLLDDISFEQATTFCPLPHLSPKFYLIHFFWSQNTEKRNNTISQMRLRSRFKVRMSILNTATTEQMRYGIVSFFVCFSSTWLNTKPPNVGGRRGKRSIYDFFLFLRCISVEASCLRGQISVPGRVGYKLEAQWVRCL